MDFAFILDPLPLLKAYKDSSVAMMRALAARGHRIYALEQADICWDARRDARRGDAARRSPPTTTTGTRAGEPEERALKDFAAVLMRKDPPFDMEYVYSTYLLEARRARGRARVQPAARDPRQQREDGDRAASAEFIAPTLVTRDAGRIGAFIDEHRDVIVKPLDGMGGTSIFRVRDDDPEPQRDRRDGVAARRADGDGAALHPGDRRRRQAHPADRRRGRAVLRSRASPSRARRAATSPPAAAAWRGRSRARDREIGEALAPTLWADGLLVVGLDVIGAYLTEVNVTSPTCFVEITEQTGFDVGGHVRRRAGARLRRVPAGASHRATRHPRLATPPAC